MILVTVGMHTDGFPRLVQAMDQLSDSLNEEIIMQLGATAYHPAKARWFDFGSKEDMERLFREARVIISHAGAGSILMAIEMEKPVIVMPRLKKYNEHFDDHQLELTEALSKSGLILAAYEADDLIFQLECVEHFTPRNMKKNHLVMAVRAELEKLVKSVC